uniref:RING finger and CHY zinc finger domain-containing protein 1-like n=1 Tax=Rhizophora mucronata TaxID=61149 RepID=A0A2P2M6L4_RHIMU
MATYILFCVTQGTDDLKYNYSISSELSKKTCRSKRQAWKRKDKENKR